MVYVELTQKEVAEKIMNGELRGLFFKNSKDELILASSIVWSLKDIASYRFFTNEKETRPVNS